MKASKGVYTHSAKCANLQAQKLSLLQSVMCKVGDPFMVVSKKIYE